MSIRAYLFDADGLDREVELDEQALASLSDRQLLWVDVTGDDEAEIRKLASILTLDPTSVESLLNPIGGPRFDNYGRYFQVDVVAIKPVNGRYEPVELDLFCGPNYIVTVHREPIALLQTFDEQVRGDTQIGQLNGPSFLAALLDWHVTSYFRVLDDLEVEVDRLDENALRMAADREFLGELVELRRRVAEVRRLLTPHREVFASLARPDFEAIASSESAAHFRALNDRLERAIEAVESAREMVIGSFELFMTGTAQSTNDTMKVLTLVTVIAALVGVIAALMSMNFEVPIYDTGIVGFAGVIALMLLLTIGISVLARWRRWY